MYEEYLMHHGVKGMKWGIRKDPERTGRQKKKKISQMSDQELRKLVERKELEKRYKNAISKPKKEKSGKKQKGLIAGILLASITPVLVAKGKKYSTQIADSIEKYGKEAFDAFQRAGEYYIHSKF